MKPWTPGPVTGPLDELVHVSRLIGSDPSLVLHSGGNTSLKAMHHDVYGEPRDALYVKGTGLGLATIDSTGFAKLDLAMVRRLLTLGELSDHDMVDELRRAMLDTSGPPPSLETILHAFLPQRVVLHTHADAFLAISNSPDGDSVLEAIYGRSAVRVGYRRPGLPLARACAAAWEEQADASTITLLLERHGVFTFGDTVEQAYGRMVDVIDAAEKRLGSAPVVISDVGTVTAQAPPAELARLRAEVSNVAGRPLVMTRTCTPSLLELTGRVGLADLVERGPVTPDHVIRTKPAPMVGRDVDGYREAYERRFEHLAVQRDGDDLVMLDPAPRVVLDPDWGLLTLADTAAGARTAGEVYLHTIATILAAESIGGFRPVDPESLFEVEYWPLEQAKLARGGLRKALTGQVAIVTGAASGIGRACAEALLAEGASVCGLDIDRSVAGTFDHPGWLGRVADVTDAHQVGSAISSAVDAFGGVDIAVIAAGVFGESAPIGRLRRPEWRRVQSINVDSVLTLLGQLHPVMAASPVAGRLVVIGSKNVTAPGRGAAAYSASKAALVQLCRVAALEWAGDGIRVNIVHPDAVFDTGLWTPDLLEERASRHGLTVEEYKRRNLLGTEVSSTTVAALVVDMCGPGFAATTGAQVPVDGGSDRVI